jgi:hypothetical protein
LHAKNKQNIHKVRRSLLICDIALFTVMTHHCTE